MALLCGKRKENLRGGPVPNQRARRPPRKLPLLGQLRKYGAYVKLGVRERKWQKWLGIGKRYMGMKIWKIFDCTA